MEDNKKYEHHEAALQWLSVTGMQFTVAMYTDKRVVLYIT